MPRPNGSPLWQNPRLTDETYARPVPASDDLDSVMPSSFQAVSGTIRALTPPWHCLLYTSPSPRDATLSRMPSSA